MPSERPRLPRTARRQARLRAEQRARQARRRRRVRNILVTGAVLFVGLLVIIGLALPSIPILPGQARNRFPDNAPGIVVPVMSDNSHIPEGETFDAYSTTPPTSGPHWNASALCGFYREELPDELIGHNLEHANVIVSYNLPNPDDVDRLEQVLQETPRWFQWGIARKYSKIPENTVALTAWGVILTLQGVQEDQIKAFFEAYAGVGGPPNGAPERVPCTATGQ